MYMYNSIHKHVTWGFMNWLRIAVSSVLLVFAVGVTVGQDAAPKVVILSFGAGGNVDNLLGGMLNTLQSYALVSEDESLLLQSGVDILGEHLHISRSASDFDFPTAALMVKNALDEEPDVIVALTAPVAQLVVSATSDMDDPPIVLFGLVFDPVEAGIVKSSCIKRDHVWGVESITPYKEVLPLMLSHFPDVNTLGIIYSSGEAAGLLGAQRIREAAELLSLEVVDAGVAHPSEVRPASLGLIEKGADALIGTPDFITGLSLPAIVSVANDSIPVFHPTFIAALPALGAATVSAGFGEYHQQGVFLGAMLAAHLQGNADLASSGIKSITSVLVAINLDTAEMQDAEITQDLMEQADAIVKDGNVQWSERALGMLARARIILDEEQRRALDQAFLESIRCTPAMIAEQQAALEASE